MQNILSEEDKRSVHRAIKHHTARLLNSGFRFEWDELYNELWVHAMSRLYKYDPERSKINTFVWNLLQWQGGGVAKNLMGKPTSTYPEEGIEDVSPQLKHQYKDVIDAAKEKPNIRHYLTTGHKSSYQVSKGRSKEWGRKMFDREVEELRQRFLKNS